MVIQNLERPKTGADSVPLPAACHDPDSPEYGVAWEHYWAERAQAEARETADEAIVQCRADADFFADGGQRFDYVLEIAVETFDRRAVDLTRPKADDYRGLSLDEYGFYSGFQIDHMRQAWEGMAESFRDLDRDRYRKAAAEFAGALANMTVGMALAVPAEKQEGGAA